MTFHGKGRKISEVDRILLKRVTQGHDLAVERSIDPEPGFPIVGGDGPVPLEPAGIGDFPGIDDIHGDICTATIDQPEIEPLQKVGFVILANPDLGICGVREVDDLYVATVEAAVDLHGTSLKTGKRRSSAGLYGRDLLENYLAG